MTDITELAQRLKAAAEKATQGNWRAFQYHDGRCGIGGGHNAEIMVCEHISKERPHDAMFIALANPANVLALVEALEKAQQQIVELQQGCENDPRIHEIIDLKERIAELESRTVKLPDLRQIVSGDRYVWSDGVYNYSQDVKVALAIAGIKVVVE
ncbi:ead/Ea22-like family protein [Klebsiella pneumoniae]|uniref:ead/Ea22-like family protein n=1 Tax=Klebsiella pneumoniae TaxID=573 RepID=UPI003A4E504B